MGTTGARRRPQKYPDELRDRAVGMVLEVRRETGERHGTITRVARELGSGFRLSGWSEELQRDVVRIAERKTRAIRRIHDPAVLDAQLTEFGFPLVEFAAVCARECQVVESRSQLSERVATGRKRELVKSDERLTAEHPYDMAKRTGVLVDNGLGTEECLIPRDASIQVAHGECDMGNRGKLCHVCSLADDTLNVLLALT
jgi:transposase